MNLLDVEIVTPEYQVFKGQAVSVMVPGTEGLFQVLYNHAPVIATFNEGNIKLGLGDGSEQHVEVAGGVVEVMKNKVIVLVEKVVSADIPKEEEAE